LGRRSNIAQITRARAERYVGDFMGKPPSEGSRGSVGLGRVGRARKALNSGQGEKEVTAGKV